MSERKPNKGDKVYISGDSSQVFLFIGRLPGGGFVVESLDGELRLTDLVEKVDARKAGEIYRVKDSWGMQGWVVRRYIGGGMFAVPNDSDTQETENTYEWEEWEEATEEEKKSYLNPWRKITGECWPDCRPGDRIEAEGKTSNIHWTGLASEMNWSGITMTKWRYAK